MAQADSSRPVTADVNPEPLCIFATQNEAVMGFSSSTSIFPC